MKAKTIASVTALALTFTSFSSAATVYVSNVVNGTNDILYANSTNTLLSSGIVTIGYFTSGFNVSANLSNIPLLLSNYTTLQSAVPGSFSFTLDGSFAGYAEQATSGVTTTIPGSPIVSPNTLIGRKLYSFIGTGATLATANSEYALVSLATILSDDPTPQDYTSTPSIANVLIGITGNTYTGNAAGQGSFTFNTIQTIPEPSALLLGALGFLGLLRRKR